MGDTDTPELRPIFDRPISAHKECLKRLCDFMLAGIGLIALSPVLMAVAALLFGLGFNKPLFIQKRVGQNGETFVIFKFRTLRDKTCRPLSLRTRRYVDSFTSLLRLTGLDELPQFINVLRGEMSLVGPRPHSIADHRCFAELIPDYANRLAVKPGMTGWAQIQGWRGPICTADQLRGRINCDLNYIARHGLLRDAVILIRTAALPLKMLCRPAQHCTNGPGPQHRLRCHRRLV